MNPFLRGVRPVIIAAIVTILLRDTYYSNRWGLRVKIITGHPVSGRKERALDPLIGFFLF